MRWSRWVAVAVPLLALAALRAADDKPPAEQVKAVIEEFQKTRTDFSKGLVAAKTAEERREYLANNKMPQPAEAARKLLDIAGKAPKSAAALDAYVWVVSNGTTPATRGEALKALEKDHLTSDKLGAVFTPLSRATDDASRAFLRAAADKNPNEGVQALAQLSLAQSLAAEVTAATSRARPILPAGQKPPPQPPKPDAATLAKLTKESDELYAAAAKKVKHLAKDDLASRLPTLAAADKGAATFIRAVIDNHPDKDLKGTACYSLATALKRKADTTRRTDEAAAKELTAEALELFERVAKEFGDLKDARGVSLGERAKAVLFELDALAIGKVVPEIEAEDVDGKTFKLSDYRGKVVLLDFWGHW